MKRPTVFTVVFFLFSLPCQAQADKDTMLSLDLPLYVKRFEALPDFNGSTEKRTGERIKHGFLAAAEIITVNGLVMAYNSVYNNITGDAAWATPTAESIRSNLTGHWEWDRETFGVNQRLHPYHGAIYYSAARVNGLNFYQNFFFSTFGSLTWEIFFENEPSSPNDLITTSTSAPATGEILYRLYLEACAAGIPAPIAFLINPMLGIHRFITCWEPPKPSAEARYGRDFPFNYATNIYSFQFFTGLGYAMNESSVSGHDENLYSFRGPFAETGISLVYGNPFEQESKIAYDHFELAVSLGMNPGDYMIVRAISDGYIFSFLPVHTNTDIISTGLSLHFDILSRGSFGAGNSTIDQCSNALDWTMKYQHYFSPDTTFQAKIHAGATLFGVTRFYSPESEMEIDSYGAGLNRKLYFSFNNKNLGQLDISIFNYFLWCFPEKGNVNWLFTDVTFSHYISRRMALGITNSFTLEQGSFNDLPKTRKHDNAAKLFVAWNL